MNSCDHRNCFSEAILNIIYSAVLLFSGWLNNKERNFRLFWPTTGAALCSFLCLETKKRTKRKFKEKSIAPHFFPLLTHECHNYWLQRIFVIAIFSLDVISLLFINIFSLTMHFVAHAAGAAPTPCCSSIEHGFRKGVGKALVDSNLPPKTLS